MRKLIVIAIVVAAMIPSIAARPALAKEHPRVNGLSCSAVAQSSGPANVWRAYFYGESQGLFNNRWPYSAAPCFRSQTDCENWLYWAQTDYPLEQNITRCHRGLR
jgi:hypothetical protein